MSIRLPEGLAPEDDATHAPGPEPNYNESMYFNFYDRKMRAGGFLRIGNRVNEKYAEVTAAWYEPDGSALFWFKREKIETNDNFDVGGCRFETIDPFRKLRLTFDHEVIRMRQPELLADPGTAFRISPREKLHLDIEIGGNTDVYFVEAPEGQWDFYKKHYEQLHTAKGKVTVGGTERSFDGLGLRDHSWGPRWWQSPDHYRWFTCNFTPEFGFMASHVALRDGSVKRGGFVWRDGKLSPVLNFTMEVDFEGPEQYHDSARLELETPDGPLHIEAEVMTMMPLRNRREGQITRISEGMTKYECEGYTGFGLSEFLDQLPAKG